MKPILTLLLFLPLLAVSQQLPIVEFDFFMETVGEDVDSVVVDVIITDPPSDTVYAYIINEVSSNANIGTDFYMDSPFEMMFLPMSTDSQQLVIYIEDDDNIEGTEAIMLAVESTVGPAITGTEAEHVVFITDNDLCVASISVPDTLVCNDALPVALVGFPIGGMFSGPGVIGDMFYPQLCEPGIHDISYMVDESNCTDSASIQIEVEVCAGIKEFEQQPFVLYPNPASGRVNILSRSKITAGSKIEVHDQFGKLVRSVDVTFNQSRFNLSIEDLTAGVYTVYLSDRDNSTKMKLIIH